MLHAYQKNPVPIQKDAHTRILLFADGEWTEHTRIGGPWESALAVWQMLKDTYYPEKNMSILGPEVDKIWELHKDKRLSTEEYISLLTTLDPFLMACREVPLVAKCLGSYGETMEKHGIKNSLKAQGEALENLKATMWARGIQAIGWEQNTLSGQPWGTRGKHGDPYNPLVEKKGHIWCRQYLRPKDLNYERELKN